MEFLISIILVVCTVLAGVVTWDLFFNNENNQDINNSKYSEGDEKIFTKDGMYAEKTDPSEPLFVRGSSKVSRDEIPNNKS